MRPRIQRSAVLVAKSTDSKETLRRIEESVRNTKDTRPFVIIFDKKLYINHNEIDYYSKQGFTVIVPKQ